MNAQFDPILVEVIKHELASITEEMAIAVWKTGRSAMVKTGDFATALCDAQGRVIGQGYAAPFQLGFMISAMEHFMEKWHGQFSPGDIFVVNDPYAGITHLPDVTVIAPAFWNGEHAGFTIAYSHHTDIGGRFAGGFSSQCGEIFEEGLRLPSMKLYSLGERNDALLDTILANVRMPEEWLGDVEAKVAGCWRGEQELRRVLDKYGLAHLNGCCEYLLDIAEQATRSALREMPDGEFVYEDYFEDDGFGTEGTHLALRVALKREGDGLLVDFCGTAGQAAGAINLPMSMTKACVYGAVKSLVDPDILTNVGLTRAITVRAPAASLVNPSFPAAVGGRAPLFFRVFDMLFRVLAKAFPDRVAVPGEGGDVLHFTGHRTDGTEFAMMDIFFGGWGARPNKDGIDGIAPMVFGSYGTIPAEILEREFPVVVEGFGYVPDTGGAGRFRGSLSIFKTWRFLNGGHAMVRTNRLVRPSPGMHGGGPGGLSANNLIRDEHSRALDAKAHVHVDVRPGDVIHHVIAGSGGHGEAINRDPAAVLEDVRNEKVSVESARSCYHVAIDTTDMTLLGDETETLRQTARDQR
ncbi:MAG: hydantoinase B/oxoprolinase family protein [Gammaproteobacteria bacterium]|nr:hydantoinase B/oxoprolinase family protein [Gammaproteobacteria bacterium]